MNNERTLNFLKSAKVAVIAGEDNKILKDFINYISGCNDDGFTVLNALQYDCDNDLKELRIATANKIISVKRENAHSVLPVEFLNRKRFVCAMLRSFFIRIPESNQTDIQLFQLHCFADELRLECEFGANAGWYIVYDYDPATGRFRERK